MHGKLGPQASRRREGERAQWLRSSGELRGEALGGDAGAGAAGEEIEDDALAEAALADLEGLAEQLGGLLEEEDAGGEDADAAGVELEASGDVPGRFGREDADAALQRLVLEHRADEAAQAGRRAADRDRLVGMRDDDAVEEFLDVVADPADLRRRGRVPGDQLVGEGAGADVPGAHRVAPAADRAEDPLGRAAAD